MEGWDGALGPYKALLIKEGSYLFEGWGGFNRNVGGISGHTPGLAKGRGSHYKRVKRGKKPADRQGELRAVGDGF